MFFVEFSAEEMTGEVAVVVGGEGRNQVTIFF
jgi:hypothetical protein